MRWVLRLQEYDLDIQYRKSEHAGDVDGMTTECPQSTDPMDKDQPMPCMSQSLVLQSARSLNAKKKSTKKRKMVKKNVKM